MRIYTVIFFLTISLFVSAQSSFAPSAEEIVKVANEIDSFYRTKVIQANQRSKELSTNISFWTWIIKGVQYVSGAGSVLFGFTDNPEAAGISGGIAALATVIEQASNKEENIAERSSCFALEEIDGPVFGTTQYWKLMSKDPEFQVTFPNTLQTFYTEQNKLLGKCHINLQPRFKSLIEQNGLFQIR